MSLRTELAFYAPALNAIATVPSTLVPLAGVHVTVQVPPTAGAPITVGVTRPVPVIVLESSFFT